MDLKEILRTMLQNEASDLHLKVGSPPVVRIHGELVPLDHKLLTREDVDGALGELTTQPQRDRFVETHELDCAVGVRQLGRFRLNVALQRGSPTLTLRSIPLSIRSIPSLHLPAALEELALRPRGLLLVTGITGSGKTTTLAAMIEHINARRRVKIVTIEDPVEYLFRDNQSFVTQREVGTDTESFANGLRHVLRQDPDVIMIGEIRDLETMETALKAANTGHLVLSTLHTTDAVQTIQRILAFFPPHQHGETRMLMSESLLGVVSLRLIPRSDGTGRVPACEVMVASQAIREHIMEPSEQHTIPDLIAQSTVQYGMQTFDQSLMQLLLDGFITQEEAISSATNPSEFALRLRGVESSSDRVWEGTR